MRQEAEAALALAKAAMKQQFDKHHSESRDYKPGDLVWLEGTNIKTQGPAKKLDHLRHRPFIIIEKVGQVAYKLKLPQTPTWHCKHDVFNELLKPFIEPSFDIQPNDPPAPPDLVEEEEEYEVEASRKKGQYIEYLVKWKGYSDAEKSWEPHGNVRHAEEEVENFHKQYPNKLKPTSSNQGIIISSNCTILDSLKPMFEFTTPSWGP